MFHLISKASTVLSLVAGAMIAGCIAGQAADNTRYISIAGKNTNPCTLAQPCKTLQRGIAMTPAGGEVQIMESGFYGNLANINKSLTISGNGNTVYLGAVLTINKAGSVVALRGLVLDGQGAIANGIKIGAAAKVHIERCVIHKFTDDGINATAAGVDLFVLDSVLRDNGNFGVVIDAGASQLTIDNTRIENNLSNGIQVRSGRASISRSILSDNFAGIAATGATTSVSVTSTMAVQNNNAGFAVGSGAAMTIESSTAHGNTTAGLFVNSGGSSARISNNTITSNNVGVDNSGATETRSNNTVRGNGNNLLGNALVAIGGI